MYIGIISAMKEEIQALLNELQIEKKVIRGMRTYYQGILFDRKVILVFSRWRQKLEPPPHTAWG